jgi:hypothetical protein
MWCLPDLFECPATRAARAPFVHLLPPGTTMLVLAFIRLAQTGAVVQNQDTLAVACCMLAREADPDRSFAGKHAAVHCECVLVLNECSGLGS